MYEESSFDDVSCCPIILIKHWNNSHPWQSIVLFTCIVFIEYRVLDNRIISITITIQYTYLKQIVYSCFLTIDDNISLILYSSVFVLSFCQRLHIIKYIVYTSSSRLIIKKWFSSSWPQQLLNCSSYTIHIFLLLPVT